MLFRSLREAIGTKLNVEMAVTEEMSRIAREILPAQVTLVPERPQELTTEGGLDVVAHADAVKTFVDEMHGTGILVSLFIDPEPEQVRGARVVGADAIEINTGRYAEATPKASGAELERIAEASRLGAQHELEVLAGHGLNYVNVIAIAKIAEILELNIGHSIVSRAALTGMDRAVRDMVALLRR